MKKLLAVLLIVGASFASVVKYDGNDASLKKRWDWALDQQKKNVWIGYAIPQKDDSEFHYHYDHESTSIIGDLLNMLETELTDVQAARQALEGHGNWKYNNDLLFIIHFDDKGKMDELKIANYDSWLDLEKQSLFWLGTVKTETSFEMLKGFFPKINELDLQKDFVAAFGVHEIPASLDVLIKVMNSRKYDAKIQKDAAFWIGQHGTEKALTVLKKAVASHPEFKVRKSAIFGISQIESDNAVDELVFIAQNNDDKKLRKEAIFWLGQKASKHCAESLKGIVYSNEETDLKKHAVFSLSQMEDDFAFEELSKIAKNHPNVEVRKSAIFWLSETQEEKAVDVLLGILNN